VGPLALFVDTHLLYMKRMKNVTRVGASAINKRLEHEQRKDPNFRGYGSSDPQATSVDSRYNDYIPPKRKAISTLDHRLRLEGDRPGQFPGAKRRKGKAKKPRLDMDDFSALGEIFEL
jgi:hypothetical protein